MTNDLSASTQSPRPKNVDSRGLILRRLWCQNPFYIISAGSTVHGIGLWFHGGDGNPWMLMGLVGGYILLMAMDQGA